MSSYLNEQARIELSPTDVKNQTSSVNQLIDILGVDISSIDDASVEQNTRRRFEVFVSGAVDDPTLKAVVKSSLFQTIYDQDFTLQTSNELLDITVGLSSVSSEVTESITQTDASGKKVFPNSTLMMREKINIYKQYAQYLLGDSEAQFYSPYDNTLEDNRIDSAIFINIKRLFTRDAIKKESFAIRLYKSLNAVENDNFASEGTSDQIYSDSGAAKSHRVSLYGGSISEIKDSNDNSVGLIFYDRGVLILDASKVFDYENFSGDVTNISTNPAAGSILKILSKGDTSDANWILKGASSNPTVGEVFVASSEDSSGFGSGTVNVGLNLVDGSIDSVLDASGRVSFKHNLKNLFISGSIDDIIDHVAKTRFKRDNTASLAFQNNTIINSTLFFCRVAPGQGNYSSNPTYIKDDGSIRVVSTERDEPFSYVTTVGLYNSSDELVAIAKTSRPIEKNPETDLSIRVRLDF